MVYMLQRILFAPLLVAMLLNLSPVSGSGNYTEVIVEFEPLVSDPHQLDYKLAMLRSMGYNFGIIDRLQNVMYGAVISIASDQVERLKGEQIVSNLYTEKFMRANLEKSLKLISADDIVSLDLYGRTLTGEGVRVAVVDTGIDYTHDDLLGLGEGGKVVGGYDFLDGDEEPMDTDGHGTLVAGIIAADGEVKGVAPKAELLAYRVASEDDYVSTIDMIRALERAVDDEVDIVNISLGLDYVSAELDRAVENLVGNGIVVVTAVGNSGERGRAIGSPASAQSAISVGASLNNVTSSLVSTLRIEGDNTRYDVIPMIGSVVAEEEPVIGRLVDANFATKQDIEDLELRGAIMLAERGGPLRLVDGREEMQMVYFSDKEYNVASRGASALIVYNNIPGIFYGKLVHEGNPQDYNPSIPVVSISREEGLRIKELIDNGRGDGDGGGDDDLVAELKLFYNNEPDIVAPFSSRGPVSPFYMKPDLIAPGAFINSTTIHNSYDLSSGTSFAAPHVAAAAALLLQKNSELEPEEVASILATTADPVTDLYGAPYAYEIAGIGRLNVTSMLESNIVAAPHYTIFHLSSTSTEFSKTVELRSIEGALGDLSMNMEWSDPASQEIVSLNATFEKSADAGADVAASLKIDTRLLKSLTDKLEGRLYIGSDGHKISIPVIVYADEVTVKANNKDGRIWLSIDVPDSWTFAKVKVMNPEEKGSRSVTLTPSSNLSSVPASSVGEHWIEADVITESGDAKGFSILYVSDTSPDGIFADYMNVYGIPLKEAFMIAAFLGIAVAVAFAWTKKKGTPEEIIAP